MLPWLYYVNSGRLYSHEKKEIRAVDLRGGDGAIRSVNVTI
jgi:hypothetical protein